MTDEERRIITSFVERVAGAQAARPAASPWGGVPSTAATAPVLPPVDAEADALIANLFARHPEARYRLTQTAFVTEAALVEAQNRIQDLEWRLHATQQQQPQRGGLFGMFGGGGGQQRQMPPRPMPMAQPGGAPGMFQQGGGSGFLGTALMTAAGVAGGMVLGNALMGMFSGGAAHAATGVADQAGSFGQEQVNTASPWTDPGGQQASNDAAGSYDDTAAGYDNAGYDGGASDGGGDYDDNV
ncbi:hypothetical protein C8P66_12273 [Humitalea rosea]|uniref:DUF2076 domain-containing protein n=1 Tax=Humitalea rosea TaxID=990373 RepID=A0A2W7I2N3_9PROT|nr:DUF2076 domain-containing protein [Humitalea rosea]PZW41086.1 hypothetical protein C8P66_12273 [Humitalea rosea]